MAISLQCDGLTALSGNPRAVGTVILPPGSCAQVMMGL
jgi:hypothetical protein